MTGTTIITKAQASTKDCPESGANKSNTGFKMKCRTGTCMKWPDCRKMWEGFSDNENEPTETNEGGT